MRRKDREITAKQELQEILESCTVCRLGFAAEGRPYVVPLNFGYAWEEGGALTLYFHCAHTGQKLDMLAQNNLVCVEVDCGHALKVGANACEYSFAYASVIAYGRARILAAAEEKRYALQKIMERQAGPGSYGFSAAQVDSVTVFCVEAQEVTGKKNSV